LSAGEAVYSYDRVIETNYIESLSDLRDIASLVPDIGPIEDFVRLIPRGKFLTAGFKMLDFASNMVLLTKFGLEPFADDIQTFARSWDEIRQHLAQRSAGRRFLHGKSVYEFHQGDSIYLDEYILEARTKIAVSFPEYAITLALAPFRNLGVEPSFTNLCDLIPFSFVADWFVNIDDRIRLGEAAASMLTAHIDYCVHSYTLIGGANTLTDTQEFNLDEVKFRRYVREVSQFYPGVSPGRFDWFDPSGGPPMLIGGSLLYQVFRH
jgi:hypothetical protein